jgi:ankyrin repeat protein
MFSPIRNDIVNKRLFIFLVLIIIITISPSIFAMNAGDGTDIPRKNNHAAPPAKKATKKSRKNCSFSIRSLADRVEDILSNALISSSNSKPIKRSNPITAEMQIELNNQLLQKIENGFIGTREIKTLLDNSAQVDARNGFNSTPLLIAAHYGYEMKCKLLIDNRAQINVRSNLGYTALIQAAGLGFESICELLINHGIEINAKELHSGSTGLMLAAYYGHESICELLLDHDATIDAQNTIGSSALILAAYNDYHSICKLLLNNGARVDKKTNAGNTALRIATARNHVSTIRALIIHPIFSPFSSEDEFHESRQRIWTSLCVFKRIYPSLPKDVRTSILCSVPELKNDVINSGAFGLTEQQTPFAPLPLVRFLIEQGKLNPEETVAAIKAHHLLCMNTHCFVAIPKTQNPAIRALIHPDNLEQNFAPEIELNIRRRLGLPLSATPMAANWIPESCSMQ